MEPRGTKQMQRLLQQVLGEESNNRQTLTQKYTVFTPMNSLYRRMLQRHRPFVNIMYMQTPLALQRLLIQENMMAEQNMDMNTHIFQSALSQKRPTTESYRILEGIISPICYHKWFSEIRETQGTKPYIFKTNDKNLPKIFTLPAGGSVAFSSSNSLPGFLVQLAAGLWFFVLGSLTVAFHIH